MLNYVDNSVWFWIGLSLRIHITKFDIWSRWLDLEVDQSRKIIGLGNCWTTFNNAVYFPVKHTLNDQN